MASTVKPPHNHPALPFNGYVDQGQCPRCDGNRAAKLAIGETPHNHQIRSRKLLPLGQCPRCDELHKGAPARAGFKTAAQRDAETCAEMRAHFADPNSRCDHLTCYQW
jgi:hypothetical protein